MEMKMLINCWVVEYLPSKNIQEKYIRNKLQLIKKAEN